MHLARGRRQRTQQGGKGRSGHSGEPTVDVGEKALSFGVYIVTASNKRNHPLGPGGTKSPLEKYDMDSLDDKPSDQFLHLRRVLDGYAADLERVFDHARRSRRFNADVLGPVRTAAKFCRRAAKALASRKGMAN